MRDWNLFEAVRKRPALFLGNDRISNLFKNLILECVSVCETDEIIFMIVICSDDSFIFELRSKNDLHSFIDSFNFDKNVKYHYPVKQSHLLSIVSEKLQITSLSSSKNDNDYAFQIYFELNLGVLYEMPLVFETFKNFIAHVAMLNPNSEIVVRDMRVKYFLQQYYHFPKGIFHLFESFVEPHFNKYHISEYTPAEPLNLSICYEGAIKD
ncbi:MAG: hypothetical protein ACRCYO_13825, partial [Bacteroidia bacterium]